MSLGYGGLRRTLKFIPNAEQFVTSESPFCLNKVGF
jgi:hypothetical protein